MIHHTMPVVINRRRVDELPAVGLRRGLGLWAALAAEPAPQADSRQLVHAPSVDAEGHSVVDHGEGW